MSLILRFFISILFIAASLITMAQKELERQTFIRVGVDLSRFAMPFINNFGQTGAEISLDTEVKLRYFPTIELGYNKIQDYTENHDYDSYGNYFRVGFNYNLINYSHRLDRNIFYIGARYGFTNFEHQADKILISNGWGTLETSLPESQLSAHWLEGVMGMRAEIIKNFYMGYTIRVKYMLVHSDYNNFTPYWVPGFGEATNTITIGMSYSIFYAIPIKNPKLDFEN